MGMNFVQMIMVRVYLTESQHKARDLLKLLHDAGLSGATLMRGVSGFGHTGHWHQADWSDLVGDLPLILEFVDTPQKIDAVLPKLLEQTDPSHVVTWPVQVCHQPNQS
jgi:PII-like signaling protein